MTYDDFREIWNENELKKKVKQYTFETLKNDVIPVDWLKKHGQFELIALYQYEMEQKGKKIWNQKASSSN